MTKPAKRIPSLDGLRAFSILIVILGHATWYFPAWLADNPIFHAVIGHGAAGVAVFFVISGYLITSILLKEIDRTGDLNLKQFYFRRTLRIFPAFYFFIGVMAILWAAKIIPVKPQALLLTASYMWAYFPASVNWPLGHSWSLSIEEQFYLLWPAALLFLRIRAAKWAMILICAMPFIRVALYFAAPPLRGHEVYMIQGWIDTVVVGCLIAIFKRRAEWQTYTRWINGATALAGLLIGFLVDPLIYNSLTGKWKGCYLLLFSFTIRAACIGVILIYAIEKPDSPLGVILNLGPVRWIGKLSYSLYLWNPLFITADLHLLPWGFAYMGIAAASSYYLIEQPCLAWRDRSRRLQASVQTHQAQA